VEPPCLAIMQPADSARPERVDTERLRSSMCGRPDYYIPNIVDLVGFHNDILYTMSTSCISVRLQLPLALTVHDGATSTIAH
jgi:hypothetical protein